MKFNRLKFLADVQEFEDRGNAMSRRRAEVVDARHGIRRLTERLEGFEHQLGRVPPGKSYDALRNDFHRSIGDLKTEIADHSAWVAELEKGLEVEAQRNQALGSLIHSMRRVLMEHGVPDPSKTVIA